jgi:hypothetical protein
MRWKPCWWPEVHIADIPTPSRNLFAQYGETVVALILAGTFSRRAEDLKPLFEDPVVMAHARDWLRERNDLRELREARLETAEWAILIFVVLGVILDIGLLFH